LAGIRAQSSVEFIVLLAIATFVLTAAVMISQAQVGDINKLKEQSDAKNAILDISAAAKDVYAQGEGAKKQVYIHIPSSYDPSASYVYNNTIRLNARGTDYVAVENFQVHGSLPGTNGGHWIWVISEGNRVRIGTAMLATSKNSIYLIMEKFSNKTESFYVQSTWDDDITVTTTLQWANPEVALSMNPGGSFPLDPSDTQFVDLYFATSSGAAGYYNGRLVFFADDGNGNNETVEIPVTVEVPVSGGLPPPITVDPEFWGEKTFQGMSHTKAFTVCTNKQTMVTSVTFTPQSGEPGDWIGNTTALGTIMPSQCAVKILNVTVPLNATNGVYSTTIDVVGQGVADAEETIDVYFIIEDGSGFSLEDQSMCNCPVGSNYWDVPLCNCMPATVYVMNGTIVGGDDNGKPYNGTLIGGSGTDIIVGTNESDIIYSGVSPDMICGAGGNDFIYGNNGGEMLDGGDGDDVIYGGAGDDKIYGKAGNDLLYGGQGWDELDGGSGVDIIYGEHGDDLIYGGPGVDLLYGGANKDIICGNADNDIIDGGDDGDDIDGGTGADTVEAGSGADVCYRSESVSNCEKLLNGSIWQCGPS